MMTTRARGLASLHAAAAAACVGGFFWAYAEFILRHVPFVRLTREVNLLPYLLCVLGGMALARREVKGWSSRFDVLRAANAARLAARQVALMALLIFTMMFATQDRSISRLFSAPSWFGRAFCFGGSTHGCRVFSRIACSSAGISCRRFSSVRRRRSLGWTTGSAGKVRWACMPSDC